MFSLLRRSKNRRSHRQQQVSEDLQNSPMVLQQQTNSSNSSGISFLGHKPQPPQRHVHGKFTASTPALDHLEDFNQLEEQLQNIKSKVLQEKPTAVSDEREAKFAKIYFEDTEPIRNINLAKTKETVPTALEVGKKSLRYDSSRSCGGARDVLNSAARRSLGFRKVDLDGVNSVIEAILTPNNAANGESRKKEKSSDLDDHHDHHKERQAKNQTDGGGERSNINRHTHQLSQNERAELSGHVSSQSQLQPCGRSTADDHILPVNKIETIDRTDSNVTKFAKVINNRESLAANSFAAGNVDSQRAEQTTKEKESTEKLAPIAAATDTEQNSSKQIKAARRRSYFLKKNQNEISTPAIVEISASASTENQQAEKKSLHGPLQRGKKLFTDIFMARGRHHANQRNNKQNQSTINPDPCSVTSTAASNNITNTQITFNNNCNAAVSSIQKSCQNAINNKDITTISPTRNNFTTDINDRAAAPTTTTMLRQHLETSNNSGNRYRDPTILSTNQMTFSINSGQKNVSSRRNNVDEFKGWPRSLMRGNGPQHQRSNSAEQHRERREPENSIKAAASKYERAYSEEPPRTERRRWSGALRDFVRATPQTSTSSGAAQLPQQPSVIRSRVTEQNGGIDADDRFVGKQQFNKTTTGNRQQFNATNSFRKDEHTSGATKLTTEECARNRLKLSENNQKQTKKSPMGQTYGKTETSAEESRASTPREFRESQIPETDPNARLQVPLPKITVSDCSSATSSNTHNSAHTRGGSSATIEHEIFYEFESENLSNVESSNVNSVQIEDLGDSDFDDEVFLEQVSNSQPTQYTNYRHHSPLHRHSPIILADVPEQEEEENSATETVTKATQHQQNVNGIDNELLRRSCSRQVNSTSVSPERGPLKSCDSNLSNSYPDSGISGCSDTHFSDAPESNAAAKKSKSPSPARSSLPPRLQQQLHQQRRRQRSPFVRDSTSTDCDDTLLQCDDLDCFASPTISTTTIIAGGVEERLVCIESISLPDVVESTTSSSSGGAGAVAGNADANLSTAGTNEGEQIVNINGATGNSMGNVHFIPIHVEGGVGERRSKSRSGSPNQQQKRRSIDDSAIGSGGMKGSQFSHMKGNFNNQPTIEIIEEDDNSLGFKSNNDDIKSEKLRLELQDQKSRFTVQLDDAQKNVQNLSTQITEMQTKIVNLEQELSTKTWNVERLQSELNASQREDEFVRKKLRLLEQEKTGLRQKFNEDEDEFKRKYAELEIEYTELQEKYKNTQKLASELQVQLARAQSEAEKWRAEVEKIRADLEDQIRILTNSLQNSEAERKICEDKWQKEFEMLRTQHMDREETLMTDCEWQLRQMQKQWKDKLDKSEHARRDAVDTAELMGLELEARKQEIDRLREYEAEVKSLRGVVSDQHNSIQSMMDQIENLKTELSMANEKLEDQIEAVKKIKYQCDNTLCDKERQMIYRIDEVRNEAASFWENRLLTEMTRLTHELESVHVDERRDALDKLQAEHIEELRAITTRYSANEDELRTELAELQERYEAKCQEFLDLREKSDNALLQTRMHLDRADREYQNAMCREEERREALEESLRKEFEKEKEEMEAKFRERLDEVKSKLMKELESSKQEMTKKHQKDLEQQRLKLRAERDEAMQELAERHRARLSAAEEQLKESELRHQRDLNELKATYDEDKAVLDKRDMSNANEIEQLHRRCRCLTNLFEEMRMRYERRDPRPEDLREIEELRTRCDSQERDLFTLTTTLREMQMQMSNLQQNDKPKKGGKSIQKPPPKTIPTSCDVIYEENEERDSPPPEPLKPRRNGNADSEESEDEDVENGGEGEDSDNNDEIKLVEGANPNKSKISFNGGNKLVNGTISEVH